MKALTINAHRIIAVGLITILISLLISQTAMAKLPAGIDPNHPIEMVLAPNQTSLSTGKLAAGQEAWFAVKVTDLYVQYDGEDNDADRPPLDLTLFVTPADGNKIRHIRMDLFPGSYAQHWSVGHLYRDDVDNDDEDMVTPFGAGRVVDRAEEDEVYITGEGDPLVGQLTWSGHVNNNETFLVRIQNGNGSPVDYSLYTDDVSNVELGQATQTKPAIAALPAGIDPNYPIEIDLVPNQTIVKKGQLAAGQETWFAVKVSDLYGRYVDEDGEANRPPLDLTLFVTPADGNKIRHIRMDLFPGSYAEHWSVGHVYRQDANSDEENLPPGPFGAGRVVDRAEEDQIYISGAGDPLVGQLSWSGSVINNETILVRIQNGNGTAVDYALYTDDIIDIEF